MQNKNHRQILLSDISQSDISWEQQAIVWGRDHSIWWTQEAKHKKGGILSSAQPGFEGKRERCELQP